MRSRVARTRIEEHRSAQKTPGGPALTAARTGRTQKRWRLITLALITTALAACIYILATIQASRMRADGGDSASSYIAGRAAQARGDHPGEARLGKRPPDRARGRPFRASFEDILAPREPAVEIGLPLLGLRREPAHEDDLLDSIEYAHSQITQTHPELAACLKLSAKVLRTPAEDQTLQAKLSDEALLEAAEDVLLNREEMTLTAPQEALRMAEVSYLIDALTWQENPKLPEIMATVKSIILEDNLSPALPLDLRRSLAGDKLELLSALLGEHPTSAAAVLDSARGTRLERLLAFALEPPSAE